MKKSSILILDQDRKVTGVLFPRGTTNAKSLVPEIRKYLGLPRASRDQLREMERQLRSTLVSGDQKFVIRDAGSLPSGTCELCHGECQDVYDIPGIGPKVLHSSCRDVLSSDVLEAQRAERQANEQKIARFELKRLKARYNELQEEAAKFAIENPKPALSTDDHYQCGLCSCGVQDDDPTILVGETSEGLLVVHQHCLAAKATIGLEVLEEYAGYGIKLPQDLEEQAITSLALSDLLSEKRVREQMIELPKPPIHPGFVDIQRPADAMPVAASVPQTMKQTQASLTALTTPSVTPSVLSQLAANITPSKLDMFSPIEPSKIGF
jgi:hypothetical protein